VGLRLLDVAKSVGLSDASHAGHWQNGSKLPTLENALRLASAIGATIEVLYSELKREIDREVARNQKRFNIKRTYE
jgi:hypothetical protein